MHCSDNVSRRAFLAGGMLASCLPWQIPSIAAQQETPSYSICAFVKFLQTLSYDVLAEKLAALGFQGIEATIRDRGQVLPEQATEELPKLVEALRRCQLDVTIMASSIQRVDQPLTEQLLRTAASLGIRRYRMAYYRYDLDRPIMPQLEALRPVVRELAALNKELGIAAVYQLSLIHI